MKLSILITLIITIAVFSYVSGYSISAHHHREAAYSKMANLSVNSPGPGAAVAAEHVQPVSSSPPSGGYGQ